MRVWGTPEGGRVGLRPLSGSTCTCVAQGVGAHLCAPRRLLSTQRRPRRPGGSRAWGAQYPPEISLASANSQPRSTTVGGGDSRDRGALR